MSTLTGVASFMKNYLGAMVVAALAVCLFASCANQSSPTTAAADPNRSSYDRNQLSNTGRHDSASQVQAIDPAVSVNNGR
jgi:hypothetical protein